MSDNNGFTSSVNFSSDFERSYPIIGSGLNWLGYISTEITCVGVVKRVLSKINNDFN